MMSFNDDTVPEISSTSLLSFEMFGGGGGSAWEDGDDDEENAPEWADADLSEASDMSLSDGWGQLSVDEVSTGRNMLQVSSGKPSSMPGGRSIRLVATLSIPFPFGSFVSSPVSASPSLQAR